MANAVPFPNLDQIEHQYTSMLNGPCAYIETAVRNYVRCNALVEVGTTEKAIEVA